MADTLLVYTHPDCEYTDALKRELDTAGTVYDEVNLALRPEAWAQVKELTGGERITPVSVEGEFVTVGFGGIG